jgi:cyclophilin family peptidyl-prolyl cis-trans isomerase
MAFPSPLYFVHALLKTAVLIAVSSNALTYAQPLVGLERLVFQTSHGDIHMGFYEDVAPRTAKHIRRLGELGAYNTVDFFRIDRGFVAQTSDVLQSRTVPLNDEQRAEAGQTVPLEVTPTVKHDGRGLLSLARHDDPNSGRSSFSIMLGPAPHLDMQYCIFGRVTAGLEVLASLESLPTKREGIFVMPIDRVTIHSTYTYLSSSDVGTKLRLEAGLCTEFFRALEQRYAAQEVELDKTRRRCLPGSR